MWPLHDSTSLWSPNSQQACLHAELFLLPSRIKHSKGIQVRSRCARQHVQTAPPTPAQWVQENRLTGLLLYRMRFLSQHRIKESGLKIMNFCSNRALVSLSVAISTHSRVEDAQHSLQHSSQVSRIPWLHNLHNHVHQPSAALKHLFP